MTLKGFRIIVLLADEASVCARCRNCRSLLEQGSQQVPTSGSQPRAEEGPSEENPQDQGLLPVVITLGVITVVLIIIVIYGYCKFVRRRRTEKKKEMDEEGKDTGDDKREEAPEEPQAPPSRFLAQDVPQMSPHVSVPVKMRKRSMTFTQTDEECRKYREDLADSYEKPPETETEGSHRFRKKSVVTFADEQKMNSDGM